MRRPVLFGLLLSLLGITVPAHAAGNGCTLSALSDFTLSAQYHWNGVAIESAGTSCDLHINGVNQGTVVTAAEGAARVTFAAEPGYLVEVCVNPGGACVATTTTPVAGGEYVKRT